MAKTALIACLTGALVLTAVACGGQARPSAAPDIEATVAAAVEATVSAIPTPTSAPAPTPLPTGRSTPEPTATPTYQETTLWLASYEQHYDIPVYGRSPVSEYMAELYPAYALGYAAGEWLRCQQGLSPVPFAKALPENVDGGFPYGEAWRILMGMTPQQERQMFEETGIDQLAGQRAAFEGILIEGGTPRYLAGNFAQIAFEASAVRAWQITEPALRGEETFLDTVAGNWGTAERR